MVVSGKDINQIMSDLENGVREIFQSDKYKRYLEVMSKFHNYSTDNWRLIYEQCPNATVLAGYKQWQKDFGRHVKRGEKAIRIIAPNKHYGFREVCVFDVSQTEGKALPDDGIVVYRLNGNLKNYKILYNALERISPLDICFADFDDKDGICYFGKKIVIRKGMSEPQTLLTILHEITHEILHKNSAESKKTREVEAESVAYAVCNYLGIDTSKNSFNYIASYSNDIESWSKDQPLETLNRSLALITKTTKELIDKIRIELGLNNDEIILENEDPESLYKEGLKYYTGDGVSQDYERAFEYFLCAANLEYEDAIYKVAVCYEYGYGIMQSYEASYKWLLKIPDNKYAQNTIGYYFDHGFGVEKNQQEAFKWFLKSAKQENSVAEMNVGLYYQFGYGGLTPDSQLAFEWYLKAADQGYAKAQHKVAKCYEDGIGTDIDYGEAFGWYLKAAKNCLDIAQFEVAKYYENGIAVGVNEEKAFEWYLQAAKQGYAKAQYEVARCYEYEYGTEENVEEAFKWYLKAAEQGHVDAQYEVARCYEYKYGIEENEKEAFKWYLKAAEQGHMNAQYAVALYYEDGDGTEENKEEAFRWCLKAAEQGHEAAQYEIAKCYEFGCGVEKDNGKAFEFYSKLLESGYKKAKVKIAQYHLQGIVVNQNVEYGVELLLEAVNEGDKDAKKFIVDIFTKSFATDIQADLKEKINKHLYEIFS